MSNKPAQAGKDGSQRGEKSDLINYFAFFSVLRIFEPKINR